MLNHRKRLRIVNDHHVVVKVVADRIFVGHFLINPSLEFSNIDAGPLQGVVHFFGDAEEVWAPLDHTPTGANAGCIHKQCQRGENLRNPAAVIGRTDVYDVKIAETLR